MHRLASATPDTSAQEAPDRAEHRAQRGTVVGPLQTPLSRRLVGVLAEAPPWLPQGRQPRDLPTRGGAVGTHIARDSSGSCQPVDQQIVASEWIVAFGPFRPLPELAPPFRGFACRRQQRRHPDRITVSQLECGYQHPVASLQLHAQPEQPLGLVGQANRIENTDFTLINVI